MNIFFFFQGVTFFYKSNKMAKVLLKRFGVLFSLLKVFYYLKLKIKTLKFLNQKKNPFNTYFLNFNAFGGINKSISF